MVDTPPITPVDPAVPKSIDAIGASAEKANASLTELAALFISSKGAFTSFGIDDKPLNKFSQQVSMVSEQAKQFHINVPAAFLAATQKAAGLADSALTLQNQYIQMSAKVGGLDEVFKQVARDGGSFNSILAQQNSLMVESMKATGVTEENMQKYYTLLGTVPKALESTVTGLGNANDRISLLTATIKMATGTGRDYTDVVGDLKTAFREYGLVGEDALKFSARFSEIANNLGIELQDVQSALKTSADAFSVFAHAGKSAGIMSEGLASIMNKYVGMLQQTGMTGHEATKTVTGMTNAIKNMGIEQKAFLSMQTGGPGGLMGGFQIEKLLDEGKVEEVFGKMREVMKKQFGKIVSLSEASQSQGAAAQFEKQILMLRQGPLGSIVKTDQEARRVLAGFAGEGAGAVPGVKGLDQFGLKTAMERGTAIEEKSYTQLTIIGNHLSAIRRSGEVNALKDLQKYTTNIGGSSPTIGAAMASSGGMTGKDFTPEAMSTDSLGKAKIALKSSLAELAEIKSFLSPKIKKEMDSELKKVSSEIKQIKDKASKMTGPAKEKELKIAEKMESEAQDKFGIFSMAQPAGKTLAAAPKAMPAKYTKETTPGATGPTYAAAPPVDINVNVTGYCLKCKSEIEGGKHKHAVSAATP